MTTTALTQKEIAKVLDNAAARATMVGGCPATGKQCWFLAGLILKDGHAETDFSAIVCDTSFVLTSKKASTMINQYLN